MKLKGNWLIRGLNLEGIMQTLQREFKNVPTDASLVCSSTSRALNREETLSAHDKVLICNNPEVNQPQQRGDSNLRVSNKVFVLSMSGKTLMPCKPQKAKKLLKGGKANVVKRFPFKRINADMNGSLNILRKVAGNEFLSSRGFVVNPVKISCGFTKSLVEFL